MQGRNKIEKNFALTTKQRLTATEKPNIFEIALAILKRPQIICFPLTGLLHLALFVIQFRHPI